MPEAAGMIEAGGYDVLLCDLGLPDGNGATLIRQEALTGRDTDILVITIFANQNKVLDAIRAGARGYLLKDGTESDLATHVLSLHAGGSPMTPIIARQLLARWRADGRIDFLGRADFQVKIRGYRIELGEIEAVLEAADGVRQAVVVAREDQPGDVRLVAYLRADSGVATDRLRDWAATRLPEHMVPAHFVTVDEFPLTPNRKVDRKALPAPSQTTLRERTEVFVAPENDVERTIAEVWARVLGVPQVGAKDNFFALGGHSLLAVQAHREIRQVLGSTKLSITDIFRFPTLEALARHLDDRPANTETAVKETAERAQMRMDAMSRRRAMRSGKQTQE